MEPTSPQPKLTPKQKAFADFYCGQSRGNATDAARRAGYADPEVSGWQNKQKVAVSGEITRILQSRTLGGEEVLERLTQHANGTLSHFIYTSGDVATLDLSTEDAQANLHLLKKVKTKRRTGGKDDEKWEEIETEIELHDPQAALVHLGRFHKLFTDKQDITSAGQPIILSDEERTSRALALLNAARARRDGSPSNDSPTEPDGVS